MLDELYRNDNLKFESRYGINPLCPNDDYSHHEYIGTVNYE